MSEWEREILTKSSGYPDIPLMCLPKEDLKGLSYILTEIRAIMV